MLELRFSTTSITTTDSHRFRSVSVAEPQAHFRARPVRRSLRYCTPAPLRRYLLVPVSLASPFSPSSLRFSQGLSARVHSRLRVFAQALVFCTAGGGTLNRYGQRTRSGWWMVASCDPTRRERHQHHKANSTIDPTNGIVRQGGREQSVWGSLFVA